MRRWGGNDCLGVGKVSHVRRGGIRCHERGQRLAAGACGGHARGSAVVQRGVGMRGGAAAMGPWWLKLVAIGYNGVAHGRADRPHVHEPGHHTCH